MKKLWVLGSQTVKTKMGKAKLTEDEEFVVLRMKCKSTQHACEELVKHVTQVVDSVRCFSSNVKHIGHDIHELNLECNPNVEPTSAILNRVGQNLENVNIQTFENTMLQQIVKPIKDYTTHFASLKKMRRELKNITLQMDYYRQRSPGSNKSKEKSRKYQLQYVTLNNKCKREMLKVLDMKGALFEQVVPLLMSTLLEWNISNGRIMAELSTKSATWL